MELLIVGVAAFCRVVAVCFAIILELNNVFTHFMAKNTTSPIPRSHTEEIATHELMRSKLLAEGQCRFSIAGAIVLGEHLDILICI